MNVLISNDALNLLKELHCLCLYFRRLKHSTVRPFECEMCSKKYALRTLLNQHIRFQHCNERPVSCDICGKGFRTKSQLQKHSYSHRENTIDCEVCEHKSWTMEGYKIHLVASHPELAVEKKIHHYTCQYCSRRFAVLHQYKRHLAIHTGKVLKLLRSYSYLFEYI